MWKMLCAGLLAAGVWSSAVGSAADPAVVGGKPITEADLAARFADQAAARERALAAQLQRLHLQYERELDAARRAVLESMIDERLLALEADKLNTSAEALLSTVSVPAVSDEEVLAAVSRARPGQPGEPDPDLLARARQQLEQQAHDRAIRGYLQSLASRYGVRMQLEPRREAVKVDDSPVRGSANARVTIVEFADFQCPYCVRIEPTLRRILSEHPEDVRLVFKQLPIPELHPDAERLARGAVCASQQGKFWELHDALFDNAGRIDAARMLHLAHDAGVDAGLLDTCMTDPARTQSVLTRDLEEANALSIGGTPALFVNGRMLQGAVSYDTLSAVISEELQASRHGDRPDVASTPPTRR